MNLSYFQNFVEVWWKTLYIYSFLLKICSSLKEKALFCLVKRGTSVVGAMGVIGQVVIFQDLKDDYDSPLLFTSKLHLSSVIFIFVRFEDSCQLNVKPSLKEHQCWTIDLIDWFCQDIPSATFYESPWLHTLTAYISVKVFFSRPNKFYRNKSLTSSL